MSKQWKWTLAAAVGLLLLAVGPRAESSAAGARTAAGRLAQRPR